ncbi:N-lysine methyltransferase KMT5A-like [Haliotis rufescens]|uniref:N-lysine methyltransferase KMT5A-like n=1 Tax=Haliotis rufescens TaxID=6454 RepID=UPI00201E9DDF|nr:N-lysine methyltransferase KMT5A-like [Haliotis rufescens]
MQAKLHSFCIAMNILLKSLTVCWIIVDLGGCQARNDFQGTLCPRNQELAAAKGAIRRSDMSPKHFRVVDFGRPRGRGIVADKEFAHGEYMLYYAGKWDVIEPDTSDDVHTFQISYRKMRFWFDAEEEDGSYGRLINDAWGHPNTQPRVVFVDGEPRIAFFALGSIHAGQEILFDYGGTNDLPWRKQELDEANHLQTP